MATKDEATQALLELIETIAKRATETTGSVGVGTINSYAEALEHAARAYRELQGPQATRA